jgi:CheY-like chemotaxis protein
MNTHALHVLLVEDDAFQAVMYNDILTALGCIVTHAGNGADAFHLFHGSRFDAVVTDYRMPKMNGLQLLQALNTSLKGRVATLIHSGDDLIGDEPNKIPIEKVGTFFDHVRGQKKQVLPERTEAYLKDFIDSVRK